MALITNELAPASQPQLPEVETSNATGNSIRPSVLAEIQELTEAGVDVMALIVPDEHRPEPGRQAMIDDRIVELETLPDGRTEFLRPPGLKAWAPLTKRAIALTPLYEPDSKLLGAGITAEDYDAPLLPDGRTGQQLLFEKNPPEDSPGKADKIMDSYLRFVKTPIDDGNEDTLGSRDFFRGVKDAEAVRTRGTAAIELVAEHIERTPSLSERQDLVSASLACGAAGPVYKMVSGLGERGHRFSKVLLVDQDPLALASAKALSAEVPPEVGIQIEYKNFLEEKPVTFIEPHSVDIVDLLGLFEYMPNPPSYPMAKDLLKDVREIVKPGGLIVFGNMLDDRPQQGFFSNVVKWFPLHQRSISQVLEIVESAGFDRQDVSVRVPAYEGVYAIYGIRIPETTEVEAAKRNDKSIIARYGKTAAKLVQYDSASTI